MKKLQLLSSYSYFRSLTKMSSSLFVQGRRRGINSGNPSTHCFCTTDLKTDQKQRRRGRDSNNYFTPLLFNHLFPFEMRWLLTIFTIFVNLSTSHAQDLCSCTPLVYKWRLDFDLFCPPANVTSDEFDTGNTGIRDVFCQIVSESNTTDLKPVSIISFQIIELSQNLTPIKVNNRDDINLKNGDVITFNSLTTVQPEEISGGLQASVNAINMNLETIRLEWLVRYSNICEKLPYDFGNSLGWMVYVSSNIKL